MCWSQFNSSLNAALSAIWAGSELQSTYHSHALVGEFPTVVSGDKAGTSLKNFGSTMVKIIEVPAAYLHVGTSADDLKEVCACCNDAVIDPVTMLTMPDEETR